ncbi:hypothetical protein HJFPF1_13176 [Paramyrothecium foliicola]|nr:hypothetical protein HJFPF1_13176 [Paramyrothecium foliicola]
MAPVTADDVPEEVWLRVFEQFEVTIDHRTWQMDGSFSDSSGKASLRSLCLVCHRFRNIAQDILYRTIVFRSYRQQNKFAKLAAVLQTNTQLRSKVRTLSIDEMDDDRASPESYESMKDWIRSQLVTQWACEVHDSTEYMYSMMAGVGAFHLTLLSQIELLDVSAREISTLAWFIGQKERLELRDGFLCDRNEPFPSQGKIASGMGELPTTLQPFHFQHLKEIRIQLQMSGSIFASDIEPIILLPTLETLRGKGVEWLGASATKLNQAKGPINIRVLDFYDCLIDAPGLQDIMQNMPRLESLSIDVDDACQWHRTTHSRDVRLNLPDIGNVLRANGENIQELNLCFLDRYNSASGELGSLQNLTSLRRLGVVLTQLRKYDRPGSTLHDLLPECLETLYLNDERRDLFTGGTTNIWYNVTGEIAAKTRAACLGLITDGNLHNLREIRMEEFERNDRLLEGESNEWSSRIIEMRNYDPYQICKYMLWNKAQNSGGGGVTRQRGGWTRIHC